MRFLGSRKRERSLASGFGLEIHGWHVRVNVIDLSRRPVWELRCEITRSREMGPEERRDRMCRAVKRFLLRDMEEAFADLEGGLDSRRPLQESDLVAP